MIQTLNVLPSLGIIHEPICEYLDRKITDISGVLKKGNVSIDIHLPSTVWSPGCFIPISFQLANDSPHSIETIEIAFCRRYKYKGLEGRLDDIADVLSAKSYAVELGPNSMSTVRVFFPLDRALILLYPYIPRPLAVIDDNSNQHEALQVPIPGLSLSVLHSSTGFGGTVFQQCNILNNLVVYHCFNISVHVGANKYTRAIKQQNLTSSDKAQVITACSGRSKLTATLQRAGKTSSGKRIVTFEAPVQLVDEIPNASAYMKLRNDDQADHRVPFEQIENVVEKDNVPELARSVDEPPFRDISNASGKYGNPLFNAVAPKHSGVSHEHDDAVVFNPSEKSKTASDQKKKQKDKLSLSFPNPDLSSTSQVAGLQLTESATTQGSTGEGGPRAGKVAPSSEERSENNESSTNIIPPVPALPPHASFSSLNPKPQPFYPEHTGLATTGRSPAPISESLIHKSLRSNVAEAVLRDIPLLILEMKSKDKGPMENVDVAISLEKEISILMTESENAKTMNISEMNLAQRQISPLLFGSFDPFGAKLLNQHSAPISFISKVLTSEQVDKNRSFLTTEKNGTSSNESINLIESKRIAVVDDQLLTSSLRLQSAEIPPVVKVSHQPRTFRSPVAPPLPNSKPILNEPRSSQEVFHSASPSFDRPLLYRQQTEPVITKKLIQNESPSSQFNFFKDKTLFLKLTHNVVDTPPQLPHPRSKTVGASPLPALPDNNNSLKPDANGLDPLLARMLGEYSFLS